MKKCDLDTPSLLLDLDVFENNLKTMRDFAAAAGKKLRPHAKTHKCPEIARRQIACGNCAGICAAKLSEAEALAAAGLPDILITSPISAPNKIARFAELNRRVENLQLTVDHTMQIEQLAASASADNPIHILIDVDPEMGRTGVAFNKALEFVDATGNLPVPLHLRNAPTKLMKELGYGDGYKYAHNYASNFVEQEYLPKEISTQKFWEPSNNTSEQKLAQRMDEIRQKK